VAQDFQVYGLASGFWDATMPQFGEVKAEVPSPSFTAGGAFLVVLMDVKNNGRRSDAPGAWSSLFLIDSEDRRIDLAPLEVQRAAQAHFRRVGVYDEISAGATRATGFVFDLPWSSKGRRLTGRTPW
jgi:hypothetical protein